MKLNLKAKETEARIEDAFWQVLDEKGLERLTVTDIIKVANINRSTFYNYFPDKYELLGHLQDQLIDGIKQITNEKAIVTSQSPEEICTMLNSYFINLLTYVKNNAKHILIMYDHDQETLFVSRIHYFSKEFFPYWAKLLHENSEIKAQYAYAGIMGMIASIVLEWFDSDFSLSVEEVAAIANDVVQKFIFQR
ncbi:TetR family transcriptional regulator [Lentilactobacillus curieae]|uniref:TetR family transcriptional regulator n=1 Tax=Lentilactobacillus curieae TaxID=1138822 RepID=A0A1S6QIK7_9LACO|nr:TetR/AcrR family transcriptional regulator [Lentilactobacillus curieae]AQW21442.1 TetR family transcriptional regulator [Lentilactobacillus curieae]